MFTYTADMHVPQTEVFIHAADGSELLRATLVPGEYVLGREETCALRIEDASLSRQHARLIIAEDHARIEDLGSANGTKVNGTPVSASVRLWPHQKIQAGSVSIELRRVKTLAPDVSLAPSTATMRELLPEEILREKKYDIGGVVAQGGMGAILNAKEAAIERTVAMKVMLDGSSPDELVRFIAEAKVTGQLEHPNIVPVHELGVDENGQVFYTMKFVRGITLRKVLELMASGEAPTLAKYPLATLLTIFQKVCDAVAFAHSKGVIHRDLKPENIMLGDFGEVLVMDWGLAKVLGSKDAPGSAKDPAVTPIRSPLAGIGTATITGSIMGTPQYMAPEQARGEVEALDERADIYALGAILYHILALRPSVVGSDAYAIVERVARGAIDPLGSLSPSASASSSASRSGGAGKETKMEKQKQSGGRIPDSLAAVVRKAMALSPAQRYASVAELQADITAFQNGFATSAENAGAWKQLTLLIKRHRGIVTTSAAALLALAGFGVWFVVNLRASERVAKSNEQLAKQNEKRAVAQEEETRRTLAQAQVAVAEAAFRSGDRTAMMQALDAVPSDLRDQVWGYLSAKRDASLGALAAAAGREVAAVAAVPGQPDSFAIAYAKGVVEIVDVRTGKVSSRVNTAFSGGMTLGFTPDGSQFAVTAKGAADIGILRTSGERVRVLPAPSKAISRLVFSPDASLLVCGEPPGLGPQGKLTLLDANDGEVRWQTSHAQSGVNFSPDGARLFVSSLGALRVFRTIEVATGKVLSDYAANVFSQAMSLDGKRIAIGLQNGEVVIFDVATGSEVRRAKLHDGEIQAMAWTAGGHLLTTGGEGSIDGAAKGRRLLRLWETTAFASRGTFFGLRQGGGWAAWAFQPASGWLITDEPTPQRWHIAVDAEAARIASRAEQGWSVAFSSDTLLLARRAFEVGLYDVSDPRFPRALPPMGRPGDAMCAVNWRAGVLAMANRINKPPHSIKLHATDAAMTLKREIPVPDHAMGLDFDETGERLLYVPARRKALVFDPNTGKELLTIPDQFQRGVFAGTAGHIAALVSVQDADGETHDSLVIFDGKTGQRLRNEPQRLRLNGFAVSPDRRLLAVAGEEQIVRVLNADTLAERWRFRAHDDDIRALAFHPSEPILASVSNDGTLKLWDYESANLRQTFYGIDGTPVALAFSPNGRLLALEAQERIVRLFDLAASAAPLPRVRAKPVIQPDADGWLDLLGAMNADDVAENGQGWRLEKGALHSPVGRYCMMPLPLDRVPESFTLRVTVRQAEPTADFGMLFPIAGRNTGFILDAWPQRFGSVLAFNTPNNANRADVVWGRQITDLEKHTLELEVRVSEPQARVEVRIDGRPLYQWSGPLSDVGRSPFWSGAAPGVISLGSNASHWIVSEVKLKPL